MGGRARAPFTTSMIGPSYRKSALRRGPVPCMCSSTHPQHIFKPVCHLSSFTLDKSITKAFGGRHALFNISTPKVTTQYDAPALGSKALSLLYLPRKPKQTLDVLYADIQSAKCCCCIVHYTAYTTTSMYDTAAAVLRGTISGR